MIITGLVLIVLGLGGFMLSYLENDKRTVPISVLFLILGAVTLDCNRKINLPEEINQVKATDTLKGYYDSKGLHIEFNNKRNQKWKNTQ